MANLQTLSRALNGVQSNAQARAAAGAALAVGHQYYGVLGRVGSSAVRDGMQLDLDRARVEVERFYAKVPGDGGARRVDPATWSSLRRAIERLFIECAGVEAAASHRPTTTTWSIVGTSILEAPGVFVAGAAAATRATVGAAAQVTGGALKAALAGLGWITPVLLAVALLVVFIAARARGVV